MKAVGELARVAGQIRGRVAMLGQIVADGSTARVNGSMLLQV